MRGVRGLILALSLFGAATSPAWAQSSGNTIDVGDGVTTGGSCWSLSSNVYTITCNVNLKGTTTTRRVAVSGSSAKNIYVTGNLYIDASSGQGDHSAFGISGPVQLIMNTGTSTTLKGGNHAAGLQVQGSDSVTITTTGGVAYLTATGGSLGAGIGGGYYQGPFSSYGESSGAITINGYANVTAYGGYAASGIGGGASGGSGQVWIGGNSTITASGAAGGGAGGGAGIGGGSCGGGNNQITITGSANVTAKGAADGFGGAGIGGGGCYNHTGSGAVTINNSGGTLNVTAGSGTYPGSVAGEGGWQGHTGMGLASVIPPNDSGAPIGGSVSYSMGAITSGNPAPAVSYGWAVYNNGAYSYSASGSSISITNASGNMSVAADIVASGGGMAGGSKVWYQFYPKLTTYTGTIAIATQPADITVREGHITGSMSAAVTSNNAGTLSYQWYQYTTTTFAGVTTPVYTAIAGANSLTFNIPATLTAGTYKYLIVASATNAASIMSNLATVTVVPAGAAPLLSDKSVDNITLNSADFSVTSDADATAIWTVVAGGTTCPAYATAMITGKVGAMTAGDEFARTLTGLNSSASYKLCFYALNNITSALSTWEQSFTTASPSAPGLSTLTVDNVTDTAANFHLTTTAAGTGYWVLQKGNRLGLMGRIVWEGGSLDAAYIIANGDSGVMSAGAFNGTLAGLSPDTLYQISFVEVSGSYQSAVVRAQFTTAASSVAGLPHLSGLAVSSVTGTSAEFTVKSDVNATGYWQLVVGTAAPAVSVTSCLQPLRGRCGQVSMTGNTLIPGVALARLTPNTIYTLYFMASNAIGDSALVSVRFITASSDTALLVKTASRKTHGTAGTFDLTLDPAGSLTAGSSITVEPRRTADGAFDVVFTFDRAVTSASATLSGGMTGTVTPTISGSNVTVRLTGAPDKKRVGITLNVDGAANAASANIGFLYGDVSGNRQVQGNDSTAVRARMGAPLSAANFIYDVNVNGAIQGADDTAVRALVGNALP